VRNFTLKTMDKKTNTVKALKPICVEDNKVKDANDEKPIEEI